MTSHDLAGWPLRPFGGRRSQAKLTPAQRDEIRRRLSEGESPQVLALEFAVSARTIRDQR